MLGMKWLLSMLNDPRSHGLWEKTAPAAPKTTALQGDLIVDVVIVGGGFAVHTSTGREAPLSEPYRS